MGLPDGRIPDWYPPIRAARYGGVPVTDALGIAWCPALEQWCLIAEAAEMEAEAALAEKARKAAETKR